MILRKGLDRFILCFLFFLVCLPSPVRAMEMRRAALLGVSALVVAGSIVYWLYPRLWPSRDTNQFKSLEKLDQPVQIGNSFYEGREISLENGAFVAQVRVPAQESTDCGIYAGVNCVGLLAKETGDESWGSQLCNKEYLKEFLAKDGEQRIAIVCNELRLAYYNYIRNCLFNCLCPPDEDEKLKRFKDEGYNTDEIKKEYELLLKSFCIKLVKEILSGERREISCRKFLEYLHKCNISLGDVNKYVSTGNFLQNQIENHIRNAFFSYFDETKLTRHEMSLEDLKKKVYPKGFDFPSEWLEGDQIEPIIRFFLGQEWPAHEDCNLYTIVPSGDDLVHLNNADYSELDCFFPHRPPCRQVLKQLKDPGVREYFHCFVLGTGRRENQAIEEPIDGHWFAVLVHKLQEKRRYIVADSLNQPRLNQDPFTQLITVLEGQEAMPLLQQAVQGNLPHLEEQLQAISRGDCAKEKLHRLLDIHTRYEQYGGTYEALGGREQFLGRFHELLEKH